MKEAVQIRKVEDVITEIKKKIYILQAFDTQNTIYI